MSPDVLVIVGIVAAVLQGLFFWAVKWLLDRYHAQLDLRFISIERQEAQRGRELAQVEKDLLMLRAELPEKYVQRNDWIRFSAVIDAKLDSLRTMIESVRHRLYEGSDGH